MASNMTVAQEQQAIELQIHYYYSSMYFIRKYNPTSPFTTEIVCLCTVVSGAVLLAFDILLTLDEEVKLVWRPKRLSVPKIAYILNRYGILAVHIYYIYGEGNLW